MTQSQINQHRMFRVTLPNSHNMTKPHEFNDKQAPQLDLDELQKAGQAVVDQLNRKNSLFNLAKNPQPAPTEPNVPSVHAVLMRRYADRPSVVEVLKGRKALGDEKYTVPLRPYSGRDYMVDGLQEAGDLVVYLMTACMENPTEERVRMLEQAVELLEDLAIEIQLEKNI